MGTEVGWHLRFTAADAFEFLVGWGQEPVVEEAVFIAGEWLLQWADAGEHLIARVTRKTAQGG